MDKINRYNQILLAIAGTGAVLILLIGGLLLLNELFRGFWPREQEQGGIIAEEVTDELLADSLRKQVLTLSYMELLDSASRTFILPVSQANLEEAESTRELLKLSTAYGSKNSYYKGGRVYNNLVIYEAESNQSTVIFDQRISISNYQLNTVKEKNYLLIEGTDNDSNEDGFLDGNDLQKLFVYDLNEHKLRQVDMLANSNVGYVSWYAGGEELIVQIGIDRDEDGKFESSSEPKIFYNLNPDSASLQPIVSADQIAKLQRLLEGRQ